MVATWHPCSALVERAAPAARRVRQVELLVEAHDAAASEAPAGPFAAVAEGRRIEAYAAAGNAAAARQAARSYLDRWPEGAHATAARRVLGEARQVRQVGAHRVLGQVALVAQVTLVVRQDPRPGLAHVTHGTTLAPGGGRSREARVRPARAGPRSP